MNNLKGIYLIVGESGSGKTSIVEELQNSNPLFTSLESYTTRPKRYDNEIGHTFISEEDFDNLKDICAYVKYNGYRYCATSEQVDNATTYTIDLEGIKYFKANYKGNKKPYVIYVNVPCYKRLYRMLKRGDGFKKAWRRLMVDFRQFKGVNRQADFIIKNINLSKSVSKLKSFILEREMSDTL